LLASTLGLPSDPELVPPRRFARRDTNHLHRSLLTTADHAQADDPASRPSAAALAGALAELAPDAVLPASDDPPRVAAGVIPPAHGLTDDLERLRATAPVPEPRRRYWPFITTTVAAAMALAGTTGLIATAMSPDSAPIDVARTTGAESLPPPATRPNSTAGPTATPRAASGTNVVAPSTTITTTTSTSVLPLSPNPGATPAVDVGGRSFSIGEPGDRIAVGPWRCDGQPRVLVLRPTTGDLFLFDETPAPGQDLAVASFARSPGATDLAPIARADDCPTPALLRADGRVVAIDLPAVAR
jgi:hypothetical protein